MRNHIEEVKDEMMAIADILKKEMGMDEWHDWSKEALDPYYMTLDENLKILKAKLEELHYDERMEGDQYERNNWLKPEL